MDQRIMRGTTWGGDPPIGIPDPKKGKEFSANTDKAKNLRLNNLQLCNIMYE